MRATACRMSTTISPERLRTWAHTETGKDARYIDQRRTRTAVLSVTRRLRYHQALSPATLFIRSIERADLIDPASMPANTGNFMMNPG